MGKIMTTVRDPVRRPAFRGGSAPELTEAQCDVVDRAPAAVARSRSTPSNPLARGGDADDLMMQTAEQLQ